MNPKIVIRNETHDDVCTIAEVTIVSFKTLEISNHTEQFIIEALRAAKALTLSLVAEMDGRVMGHIAFSPVTISDGTPNWYGLGPVSVLPDYYRKFGFKNMSGLVHEGVPQEVFFALSFDGHTPQGTVAFHKGFKARTKTPSNRQRRC